MRWSLAALLVPIVIAAVGAVSCQSSSPSDAPAGDARARPDAAAQDSVDAGDDLAETPRPGAVAASVANERMHGPLALSATKAVLSAFIEDDPTLNLTQDAAANAAAIAARIDAQACAAADVTHASGSATVTVDFGSSCALADTGVTVSGKASVTVTVTGGDAGSKVVAAAFTFTRLVVDGYTLDGTASVSTSDLRTYALKTNLTLSGVGTVTFDGTAGAAMDTPDAGASLAVTLDGAGTWTGAVPSGSVPGAGCVAGASTFAIAKLHRRATACFADAGTVTVTIPYTCTVQGKRDAKTTTTVNTTARVTFSSATATSGQVSVEVTVGTAPATTESATLPARACGTLSDGGPG